MKLNESITFEDAALVAFDSWQVDVWASAVTELATKCDIMLTKAIGLLDQVSRRIVAHLCREQLLVKGSKFFNNPLWTRNAPCTEKLRKKDVETRGITHSPEGVPWTTLLGVTNSYTMTGHCKRREFSHSVTTVQAHYPFATFDACKTRTLHWHRRSLACLIRKWNTMELHLRVITGCGAFDVQW